MALPHLLKFYAKITNKNFCFEFWISLSEFISLKLPFKRFSVQYVYGVVRF